MACLLLFTACLLIAVILLLLLLLLLLLTSQQFPLNFGHARRPIVGSSQSGTPGTPESIPSTNEAAPGTRNTSDHSSDNSVAGNVTPAELESIPVASAQTSADVETPAVDAEAKVDLREQLPETALPDSAKMRFALVGPSRPKTSLPHAAENSPNLTGDDSPLNVAPEVKSVVFVIDKSGSMSGNKIERTKQSLMNSLSRLEMAQSFSVILFDETAHPLNLINGRVKLSPATRANIAKVKSQLDGVVAVGGTQPLDAVQVAISLRPELIILLSDGEFDPSLIEVITEFNHRVRRNGRIDCVGLNEDVLTLREVAKRNHGVYYQAVSR